MCLHLLGRIGPRILSQVAKEVARVEVGGVKETANLP